VPDPRDRYLDVWKWIAISAMSGLIGLLGGQFIPNRSIVTSDQLTAATKELKEGQQSQQIEIENLTTQVAVLTTELKLQNKIP
jgi:hypothetical protein